MSEKTKIHTNTLSDTYFTCFLKRDYVLPDMSDGYLYNRTFTLEPLCLVNQCHAVALAAKEQGNVGREESKEGINKGEKDEMTIVSTATLSEGLDADVFCLLTSLPLRNRVLAIKKKKKQKPEDSFLLSSILVPPFLHQHDTSLECWITIELLHLISGQFL